MINDLNTDLKENYQRYNQMSNQPLLFPSVLFNSKYRKLDSEEVRHFISIYIRHKYGAFHSLHNTILPRKTVEIFNKQLTTAIQNGKEISQALIEIMEEFSFFIEPFALEVYERQHRDVLKVDTRKNTLFSKLINFFKKG